MSETEKAHAKLQAAFDAFNAGNPELLIGAYASRDVLLIGTDEANWIEDTKGIAAALREECGQVRAEWKMRAIPLGGDGVLLVGRVSFVLPDGAIFPGRATYVLRREGDEWRIAHTHLSVPRAG